MTLCESPGCSEPARLFIKGYGVCVRHGDAVIDRLRETGVSVHKATVATVEQVLRKGDTTSRKRVG